MDKIYAALISHPWYALSGLVIVIALLLRRRKNRRRQIVETSNHSYRCLSITLPVGSDTLDDDIENASGDGRGISG